jgi:hypothetical protein
MGTKLGLVSPLGHSLLDNHRLLLGCRRLDVVPRLDISRQRARGSSLVFLLARIKARTRRRVVPKQFAFNVVLLCLGRLLNGHALLLVGRIVHLGANLFAHLFRFFLQLLLLWLDLFDVRVVRRLFLVKLLDLLL